MEALGTRLARDLRDDPTQAQVGVACLREVGSADPEQAAAAIREAAQHPDLAKQIEHWAPALLASADPGHGARALAELASAAREDRSPLQLGEAPQLTSVLASSPFLARLLRRHPSWWKELLGNPPAPATAEIHSDWDEIRSAKYRGLLRIVARDLAGRPFRESLYELSDLADACLDAALRCAANAHDAAPPALFALGKLGGRELNFSSDVDLLFLEDPATDDDPRAAHESATRVVQAFKRGLEERSADGFGYRVDLDLRPEGRAGVLTNSLDAALSYYESFGAEWERQMLIRLRPLAGGEEITHRFCQEVRPFVFRRSLAPDALNEVRRMKARIESERRAAGRDLDYDLKEGPGGIRDVEFLVQALQLFHGGRRAALRSGNVLETLDELGTAGLLPADTVATLSEDYLWLRRAEHALQLPEEKQTARFPKDAASQLGLARRMGYRQLPGLAARDALLADWSRVRSRVREPFDDLVLAPPASPSFANRLLETLGDNAVLRDAFQSSDESFTSLRGDDAAARKIDGKRLAGLARMLAAEPRTASFLGHRPGFLERLAQLTDDDLAVAEASLANDAEAIGDLELEDALDALRLRRREASALVACFDLGDAAPFERISDFLSELAETSTQIALQLARQGIADAPDLAVLGMGKIAGREFTYHSDLDLVFLYPGGPEAVAAASRIAQRLIAYLTTSTGAGIAYAVDTRLRPSGGQGMLVTSFRGFEDYQTRQAQTWEHLALLRARPIAGEITEAQELLQRVRGHLLGRAPSPWPSLLELRSRVEEERAAENEESLAIKTGPGGLMDVDFIAGGGLLELGAEEPPAIPSVRAMLDAWGAGASREALLADYRVLRIVEARARFVTGRPVEFLRTNDPQLPLISALVAPGMDRKALIELVSAARTRIRGVYARVSAAASVVPLRGTDAQV